MLITSDQNNYKIIGYTYYDKRVVGGSSKILNFFINKYNPDSIAVDCDLTKVNVYDFIPLGFNLIGVSEPGEIWVNHRYMDYIVGRDKAMQFILDIGINNTDISIDEIMKSLHYTKIYDCGNLRFVWRK